MCGGHDVALIPSGDQRAGAGRPTRLDGGRGIEMKSIFHIGDRARFHGVNEFPSFDGIITGVRLIKCKSIPSYYRVEVATTDDLDHWRVDTPEDNVTLLN